MKHPSYPTILTGHPEKESVMKEVLEAKAEQCPKFKKELLKTDSNILTEAVRGDTRLPLVHWPRQRTFDDH